MAVEFPALPYERNALEPHLSAETLDYHYGKHHKAYVDTLNKLIEDTEFDELPLESIVRKAQGALFDNAAQAWNHAFYWNCLKPAAQGGGDPSGKLAERLDAAFGDLPRFKQEFARVASGIFGAGWAWLVQRPDGSLGLVATINAGTPITGDDKPLLAIDMWEHAYYIDYRNARSRYIESFWSLVNWDFVAAQLR